MLTGCDDKRRAHESVPWLPRRQRGREGLAEFEAHGRGAARQDGCSFRGGEMQNELGLLKGGRSHGGGKGEGKPFGGRSA